MKHFFIFTYLRIKTANTNLSFINHAILLKMKMKNTFSHFQIKNYI